MCSEAWSPREAASGAGWEGPGEALLVQPCPAALPSAAPSEDLCSCRAWGQPGEHPQIPAEHSQIPTFPNSIWAFPNPSWAFLNPCIPKSQVSIPKSLHSHPSPWPWIEAVAALVELGSAHCFFLEKLGLTYCCFLEKLGFTSVHTEKPHVLAALTTPIFLLGWNPGFCEVKTHFLSIF